jgi:hypothetical protein
MRSLLEPLPRQLSTKALALVVALVVLGTGIAVVRYLDAAAPGIAPRGSTVWAAPAVGADSAAPRALRPAGASPVRVQPDACSAAACSPAPAASASAESAAQPSVWRPTGG